LGGEARMTCRHCARATARHLGALADAGGPLGTREAALERFRAAAVEVWGKFPPQLELSVSAEPPKEDVYAAISYAGAPWAIGRSLIRYPRSATLLVSDAFLQLDAEKAWKVLLHEAVHLGYRGHGKDFRDVAREVGAVVSGAAVESGGAIEVQKKIGSRYKTVRTFPPDQEREALAWGREQARLEHGSRWRMQQ
jgi:hypothetical protein